MASRINFFDTGAANLIFDPDPNFDKRFTISGDDVQGISRHHFIYNTSDGSVQSQFDSYTQGEIDAEKDLADRFDKRLESTSNNTQPFDANPVNIAFQALLSQPDLHHWHSAMKVQEREHDKSYSLKTTSEPRRSKTPTSAGGLETLRVLMIMYEGQGTHFEGLDIRPYYSYDEMGHLKQGWGYDVVQSDEDASRSEEDLRVHTTFLKSLGHEQTADLTTTMTPVSNGKEMAISLKLGLMNLKQRLATKINNA